MNVRRLYDYIASKSFLLDENHIDSFVSEYPECKGALEYLVAGGYVRKRDKLYGITEKIFFEYSNNEDEGHDTDWGRGDRDHLVDYEDDYER